MLTVHILKHADVADVVALATEPGLMALYYGARGRAGRDGGGVQCAGSGGRRLCHRARHTLRRRWARRKLDLLQARLTGSII